MNKTFLKCLFAVCLSVISVNIGACSDSGAPLVADAAVQTFNAAVRDIVDERAQQGKAGRLEQIGIFAEVEGRRHPLGHRAALQQGILRAEKFGIPTLHRRHVAARDNFRDIAIDLQPHRGGSHLCHALGLWSAVQAK